MSRVAELAPEALKPADRAIYDAIAGVRDGTVRGPFAIWLHTPSIAEKANWLGNALRVEGTIDKRLFELAILVVARDWTAQYEWHVHAAAAERHGIAPGVIDAIARGEEPAFVRSDEAAIHAATVELMRDRTLSAARYDAVLKILGLEGTIELISVIGFYTMVAVVLNAFEAPVPGGKAPLLPLEARS